MKATDCTTCSEPVLDAKLCCPCCGLPGQAVALQTLKHQVKPEHLETVETGSFKFCRTATCDVVYFKERGTVVIKADARVRVGIKETEDPVPICYCFGFTAAMAGEEIGGARQCTIPQRI